VSVAQYEDELNGSIMPLLDAKFAELDEGSAQVLFAFLSQVNCNTVTWVCETRTDEKNSCVCVCVSRIHRIIICAQQHSRINSQHMYLFIHLCKYHGMVRYHSSTLARKRVLEALEHVDKELGLVSLTSTSTIAASSSSTSTSSASSNKNDVSLQQLALSWALNRSHVDYTVVGLTSTKQVEFAGQVLHDLMR
jgi:aryl-alcohol dehydrogenase-like predicted oxidoreductase